MYALLLLILGAQTGLVVWKQKHKRSYELVTLLGLWLMPAIFSIHLHFWRFLVVWVAFTAVTLHLLYLCSGKKKVDKETPRKVRCCGLLVVIIIIISSSSSSSSSGSGSSSSGSGSSSTINS